MLGFLDASARVTHRGKRYLEREFLLFELGLFEDFVFGAAKKGLAGGGEVEEEPVKGQQVVIGVKDKVGAFGDRI